MPEANRYNTDWRRDPGGRGRAPGLAARAAQRLAAPLVAVVGWVALSVLLTGCGPAKMVNVEKAFVRYHPIYEATRSSLGAEALEPLVRGMAEVHEMARLSQEVPFPPEQVWQLLMSEAATSYPPGSTAPEASNLSIVTKRFRAGHFAGSFYELYIQGATKLVPTPYGTTVIHYGLIRWETSSEGGGSIRLQLRPREDTFRYALVGMALLLEKLDPEVPLSSFPTRVSELRREHELAQIAPAELHLSATLDDSDSLIPNGALDPGERSYLRVALRNGGKGRAVEVRLLAESQSPGIGVGPVDVGEIGAGESKQVRVELRPALEIAPGHAIFTLHGLEGRGYHSKPLELAVPVAPLVAPSLAIRKVELDDRGPGGDGDGRFGTGETVVLRATIENSGSGPALDVTLTARPGAEGFGGAEVPVRIPEIAAFGSAVGSFSLSLPTLLAGDSFGLEIHATDARGAAVGQAAWSGSFPIILRAPLIEIRHRFFDGNSPRSSGNRDGVANNGERLEIEIQALNRGRYAADPLTLQIRPAMEGIGVTPPILELGAVPAGAEAAPQRLLLEIPRGLDAAGVVVLHVGVRPGRFSDSLETLELPFAFESSDVRLGPTTPILVAPGREEERSLSLTNLGTLDAQDVRLLLRSPGGGLDIVGIESLSPSGVQALPVGRLTASAEVLEVPVHLFAKRGFGRRQEILEVTIEQADFAPRVRELQIEVSDEVPERVRLEPRAPLGAPDRTGLAEQSTDRAAPDIWLFEPEGVDGELSTAGPLAVSESRIRVRGRVHDPSGIYEVLVKDEMVGVGPDGEFSAWVPLAHGGNTVSVKATDLRGNIGFLSFEVQRNQTAQARGRRKDQALIFATGIYERWPALPNPVRDGESVRALLESLYGFEVELVVNPTRADILQTLRHYASSHPGPEDQLLVFFAGHGTYDERFREGYVVARDSSRDEEVRHNQLSHSELATILNNLPYRHVLVVLDVCFGGVFDQRVSESRTRGEEIYEEVSRAEFIRRQLEPKSRLYLASGGKEYVPDGLPDRHSPFVRRLIQALNGGGDDRILTMGELSSYLEKLRPEPRAGSFGASEPGGAFLFVQADR